MSNIKKLKVVSVTPMHTKGDATLPIVGYKHKLTSEETVSQQTAFGTVNQTRKETYYMVLAAPCEVGFEAPLDLDNYTVIEKEFIPQEGENAGKPMMLKNIYIKA